MQRTKLWNKLHIYRDQIILAIICLSPFLATAQYHNKKPGRFAYENDLKFQRRKYHFGIALGVNSSNFKINLSEKFIEDDSIMSVNVKNGMGFNLGILTSFHLSKNFELRTVPTVSFMEKTLQYGIANGSVADKKLEQIFIEAPFHLKFKSDPISNFKVYVFLGIKYGYDLASNSKARNAEDMVKLSKHEISADYGVGMEFHFPLFILSPEFRVSNSLVNTHSPDDALIYSRMLKGLHNRVYLFSIIFEG